jgi:hypothetical protein
MLSQVLGLIGLDLKRKVREVVVTIVFALLGAILILLALGFGIAALYEVLKIHYGTLPALGIVGGVGAVLGILFLALAFWRPSARRKPQKAVDLQDPAAAIVEATEQAVNNAIGLVRDGSRGQILGAVAIAAVAGFLIGRRL